MVQIDSSAGDHIVVVILRMFLTIIVFSAVTVVIINVSVVGADHAAVSVFQHCLVPLLQLVDLVSLFEDYLQFTIINTNQLRISDDKLCSTAQI